MQARTGLLQQTQDLVAGHALHLADGLAITEHHTDLGRREALLGQLGDLSLHHLAGHLGRQPCRRRALVGQSRSGNALARRVHATHGDRCVLRLETTCEVLLRWQAVRAAPVVLMRLAEILFLWWAGGPRLLPRKR